MKILYFAWLKTHTGTAQEDIELPAGVTNVAGLIGWLKGRGPGYEKAFANMDIIRAAVNLDFAGPGHPVEDSDEVAFFPPITGG